MHRYIGNKRVLAILFALVMLAGCGSEDGMKSNTESAKVTVKAETSSHESEYIEYVTETSTVDMTETSVPETEPAVTEPPVTEPPVTEPPVTEPPVTEPPVTEPPVTEPPVTEPPVTEPPVTEPPVTNPGVSSKGYPITVVNGITYVDGVLIANKTYALPETYNPAGLTSETFDAFIRMQSAASAQGLGLYVKSGFRSYYDQRYIYNGYAASDGVAAADRYSARAGHSEHQSGMAIDVNSTYTSFKDTPEGIWLRDNCHLYGFIIRYPEGKEHITGYMYEPWHVRYVGVELATKIKESGLCLEEYFGITSVYEY